ncbi:response regulator [Kordia sp. SMS9]|uniref:tetratricopeptide repeat-containing hybrid sensor histidine kinase/response regulator n=1 Tax=Kordia sp. SMS9 TaxID=2282170 RepID=UPI0013B42417|nr:response regulator [Kordia sp. SMS9]
MKNVLRTTTILYLLMIFPARSQDLQEEQIRDSISKYINIASETYYKYQYREAIEAANTGIKFANQINDYYFLTLFYNELGLSYDGVSEFSKAKKNYLESLRFSQKVDNDTIKGWVYNNLANLYSEGFKKTDSALIYYKESLRLAEKIKDTSEILTPIINIGWTYADKNEYDTAFPYLEKSEQLIFTKHGDNSAKGQICYLLGRYHLHKNNLEVSDTYFQDAIAYSEKAEKLEELTEIYDYYSRLADRQGKHKLAFNRLQTHLKYRDSVFNRTKIEENQKALAKFEVEDYKNDLERVKKEQKSQETIMKKSQQISYVLMIAGFILILLLINMFKNYKFRNKALNKLRSKNAQLREAKEEAESQANLKAQFFSTVSHELRTPMYGVVGLTSLLSEDFPSLKNNENFKSLKFSSTYLLSLINNVLQINKIESQGVKLESIPFNVKNLMNEVVNSFSFAASQNKNKVHQEIDPNIPEILLGDSVRLSQILMNLIGNAIKFTENGNIWIRLESEGSEGKTHSIKFVIQDDGIGIPEEKQVSVFDKFVQLRPIEKNYQGTGLGLSIVKRLLLLFDSDILLKSEEGNGTEFSFSIAFEESTELSTKNVSMPIQTINTIEKTILIVDDNKINRVVTKRILQNKGFQCDVAEDGLDAIDVLKESTFDLILMDINMPRIDGIETTKRIRETDQKTPIIALTAVEEDQIRDRIYEAGMNDFIIKPYDLAEFHQIILKNLYINII